MKKITKSQKAPWTWQSSCLCFFLGNVILLKLILIMKKKSQNKLPESEGADGGV